MSAEREQAVLDRISQTLAALDHEQRMVATVNGFVFSDNAPASIISALAQVMVSLAHHIDDDKIKMRVARCLRDGAAIFEQTITKSAKGLH